MEIKNRKRKSLVVLSIFALVAVVFGAIVADGPYKTSVVTTTEPLTISVTDDLAIDYPGLSDDVTLTVENAASVGYGLLVTPVITGTMAGNTTISDGVVSGTMVSWDKANGKFNVAAGAGTGSKITYTITTDSDAAPGTILVSFVVERLAVHV